MAIRCRHWILPTILLSLFSMLTAHRGFDFCVVRSGLLDYTVISLMASWSVPSVPTYRGDWRPHGVRLTTRTMCYSQANNKYDSTFLRLFSILLTLPYTVHALTIMLTAAGVIWNTVTSTLSSMHAPHAHYALLPSLKPLSTWLTHGTSMWRH